MAKSIDTAGFGCRQTMTVGNTPASGGQSELQDHMIAGQLNTIFQR